MCERRVWKVIMDKSKVIEGGKRDSLGETSVN